MKSHHGHYPAGIKSGSTMQKIFIQDNICIIFTQDTKIFIQDNTSFNVVYFHKVESIMF